MVKIPVFYRQKNVIYFFAVHTTCRDSGKSWSDDGLKIFQGEERLSKKQVQQWLVDQGHVR